MYKQGKIKYILPEFMWFSKNEILLNIFENYRNILRNDISIYSIFGTFPNAIWNGGSYVFGYKNYTKNEMKKIRDFYNKKGIIITFTFTNQLITEEHLSDEYCNQILEVFHNGKNEILVVSEVLEKYLRTNYPKYKINRSIINTEKIPHYLGDYHLTVMSKFKNRDFEFIKNLSLNEKEKTELLCDEFCINNCPYAYEHYKEYAYIQINAKDPENAGKNFGKCRFTENKYEFLHKRWSTSKYRITYEDIVDIYVPLGFKYFKLSGRGKNNPSSIINLVNYLIIPKYQVDVRTYIFERMISEYEIDLLFEINSKIGTVRIDNIEWEYLE